MPRDETRGDPPDIDSAGRRSPRPRATRSALRPPKTSEVVAKHLVAYIAGKDLPEGTFLPPEKEMVSAFGVGRTTVREALRLLESRGVLTVRTGPGGGPVVRRARFTDLVEPLCLMLQLRGASLADVSAARAWAEAAAARIAATRITPDEVSKLRAINTNLSLGGTDASGLFAQANGEFHQRLWRAAGNPVLSIILTALSSVSDGRSLGWSYTAETMAQLAADHELILDALAAGDPDGAYAAVHGHLIHGLQYHQGDVRQMVRRPVRWTRAPLVGSPEFAFGDSRPVEKAAELIARELTDEIVSGAIPEHTRLTPEREMAEQFGVGRATLREALRILEARGLLYMQQGPGGGPIVRHPSPAYLGEDMALILQFEHATVRDILGARVALEPDLVRMAARRETAPELAALLAANDALLATGDDDVRFRLADREFHRLTALASGNTVVALLAEALLTILDGQALDIHHDADLRQGIHDANVAMLGAIADGDGARAAEVMSQRLADEHRMWSERYPAALATPVRWASSK